MLWNDLGIPGEQLRRFCFASWVAQSRSLSIGRRVNTRHSLGLECEAINGG
jgi:hypothetical protein